MGTNKKKFTEKDLARINQLALLYGRSDLLKNYLDQVDVAGLSIKQFIHKVAYMDFGIYLSMSYTSITGNKVKPTDTIPYWIDSITKKNKTVGDTYAAYYKKNKDYIDSLYGVPKEE